MKFYLKANEELEGWDVMETDGINTEEGYEDSVVAIFYESGKAVRYIDTMNYDYYKAK